MGGYFSKKSRESVYQTEFKWTIHNWRTIIASTSRRQLLMKPEPPRAAQLSRFLLPMGKGGIHYQEFHVIAFPAIKEPSGEYGMVVGLRPVRPLNTSSLHGIYEITCTDCNFQSFLRDGLHNLNVGIHSRHKRCANQFGADDQNFD
jgi:hypothetical protein